MCSPLLSDISYGESAVKDKVTFVILTTPPLYLMIHSDNIISVFLASTFRTGNIFSQSPMVNDNIGILSKLFTLESVAPLNTCWKKLEYGIWGADISITTHGPSFTHGISSLDPLVQVCDTVLHLST